MSTAMTPEQKKKWLATFAPAVQPQPEGGLAEIINGPAPAAPQTPETAAPLSADKLGMLAGLMAPQRPSTPGGAGVGAAGPSNLSSAQINSTGIDPLFYAKLAALLGGK